MKLDTEWIDYAAADGSVAAYRAGPAPAKQEPLPAVIVIQEVWGPDEHIRDVAERLATAGYLALAPDLYSYGGRPAALEPERIRQAKAFLDTLPGGAAMDPERRAAALAQLPEEEAEPLGETLGILLATQRPMDRYVEALRGAVAHARAEGTGSVGSVGFCLGGGLSARLAAAEPALGAAVVFYGISPPAEQAAGIACPVLGIYGGEDARVNKTVEPFAEAMAEAGKSFDHHTYEGAAHAFFNDTRRVYNVAAARDAWARTLTFLAANLR